jgi:Myo-inositol-1-phosphate synthase
MARRFGQTVGTKDLTAPGIGPQLPPSSDHAGNMDFKNVRERQRLDSRKISKTQSVTSQIERGTSSRHIHVGPSDHLDWLADRKWAYIRLESRAESRGVGLAELGRRGHRRGQGRQGSPRPGNRRLLLRSSAYFMKSPPAQ